MIAYVGNDAETSTTFNHGLALALTNAENSVEWCSQKSEPCLGSWYKYATDAEGDMAGIANTDALVAHTGHTHTAATAARNYNSGTHPTGTSAWFLPSAGQWVKMVSAAGGYATLRDNAGLSGYSNYWSSTEEGTGYEDSWAWYYGFSDDYHVLDYGQKNKGYAVRSALAF